MLWGVFTVVSLLLVSVAAADPFLSRWDNLTNGLRVRGFHESTEAIWIATTGGLTRINRVNGEKTVLTRGNSGLTSNKLHDAFLDSGGTLWVGMGRNQAGGSQEGQGLARFDGRSWRIGPHEIFEFAGEVAGRVWARTAMSVQIREGEEVTSWSAADFSLSGYATSVAPLPDGGAWLGFSGGLVHLEADGTFDAFTSSNSGLPSSSVTSVAVDDDGLVWIGTRWENGPSGIDAGGLTRFDGTTWTTWDRDNSPIPSLDVTSVAVGPEGSVWLLAGDALSMSGGIISARNAAFLRFDAADWTLWNEDDFGPLGGSLNSLEFGASGAAMIATAKDGLLTFREGSWAQIDPSNSSLPFGGDVQVFPNTMALGPDESLWMGFDAGEIARVRRGEWLVWDESNSVLTGERVSALAFRGPTVHAATLGDGLFRGDDLAWHPIASPRQDITALDFAPDGTLWLGTPNDGVASFDDSEWSLHLTENENGLSRAIASILADSNGEVWVGTTWGLGRFDGSSFQKVYGGPFTRVVALHEDASGRIWAGTAEEGVGVWDGQSWTTYDLTEHGLPFNEALSFASEPAGDVVWIGTVFGGLARFDGTEWSAQEVENSGIAADYAIRSLVRHPAGSIWCGIQYGGISVLNRKVAASQPEEAPRRSSRPPTVRAHPNPIRSGATFDFTLANASKVDLSIYDVTGRLIRRVVSGRRTPGRHSILWDARDGRGLLVPSGVYFARWQRGDVREAVRLVVTR